MDYNVWDALHAGFTHVVLVIRREVEQQIRSHVTTRWGRAVTTDFAYQDSRGPGSTRPWGTAHAVLAAGDKLSTPFVVVNADDCYGAPAFKSLMAHFRTDRTAHALVGYPIATTLSPNGGVSRAVCEITPDGFLTGLTELHNVRSRNHHITGTTIDGMQQTLSGSETVSMNIWGFQPSIIPLLQSGFTVFSRARYQTAEAEYLLSDAVRDVVAAGAGRCRILGTRGHWCGVTFQEDTEWVQRRLKHFVDAGEYPADIASALRNS